MGRESRLAARKLHRQLPPRLDLDRVVQDFGDLIPGQFMDKADLVGVHETWVAHHVAAVRQIDGEHRAAPVLDGAAPVIVQLLVVVRADVTAWEDLLDVFEERRVYGQCVFVMAVDRTVFNHQDVAVALDDGRLDLADLSVK
jgi:hypothetical protein